MTEHASRIVTVREGRVRSSGSWLYVWIDTDSGAIAYVGATGYDPELRAHLHLESEEPSIGRVRATVDRYAERDFDVLAFALPGGVDRAAAKGVLEVRLAGGDVKEPLDDVVRSEIDAIARAVERAVEAVRLTRRG